MLLRGLVGVRSGFVLDGEMGDGVLTIWKEEKGYDSPGDGDGSENQEDVHPFCETCGDMSDCVTDQAAKHCFELVLYWQFNYTIKDLLVAIPLVQ